MRGRLRGSAAFNAYFYGKDYISHVAQHGYPSLQEMGSDDTPLELQRVFRLATMKDPAERYPTAQAFLADLVGVSLRLGLTVRAYEEPSDDPPTPPAWSGFVTRKRPREIGARRVPRTVTLPEPMAQTAAPELPSSQRTTPVYPPKGAPAKPTLPLETRQPRAARETSERAVVLPFAKPPTAATRRLPTTLVSEGQQTSGLRPHVPSAPWIERPVSSDAPMPPPPTQADLPPDGASRSSLGDTQPVELSGRASEPNETARSATHGPPSPASSRRGPRPPLSARAGRASLITTFVGVALVTAAPVLIALAQRPKGATAPILATTSQAALAPTPDLAPAAIGEAAPTPPVGGPADSPLPLREPPAAVIPAKASSPKTPARERPQGRAPAETTPPKATPSDGTRFKRGLDSGF